MNLIRFLGKSTIEFVITLFFIILVLFLTISMAILISSSPEHEIALPIPITHRLKIDVIGAILPIIISFLLLILLFHSTELKTIKYLSGLIVSLFLNILFFSNFITLILNLPNSILMKINLSPDYFWIGFTTSLFSVILSNSLGIYLKDLISKRKVEKFSVNLKNKTPYLLSVSYSAFALFLMDLVFVPLTYIYSDDVTITIGGDGITDGILLAPLFSALFTLFFSLILIMINKAISFPE